MAMEKVNPSRRHKRNMTSVVDDVEKDGGQNAEPKTVPESQAGGWGQSQTGGKGWGTSRGLVSQNHVGGGGQKVVGFMSKARGGGVTSKWVEVN